MASHSAEHTDSHEEEVVEQPKEEEYSFIRGTLHDKWAQANWEAEAPEILPDEIKRGKKLAQGSFGVVYKGKCRGEIVAIKELSCDIDDDVLEEFRREVAIMRYVTRASLCLTHQSLTPSQHCSFNGSLHSRTPLVYRNRVPPRFAKKPFCS